MPKKSKNFTHVIVLFGILVVIFYIAVMIYYYQQFLFFPKSTELIEQDLKNQIISLQNQLTQINQQESDKEQISLQSDDIDPEIAKQTVSDQASQIIRALEKLKFDDLAKFVHPENGLRFSPYAYVTDEDIVFSAEHLARQTGHNFMSNEKYPWGIYDGSGEPIDLTFSDYYYRFIYDKYYSNADSVLFNQSITYGNTINNVFEYYDNSIVVEYYFAPVNPKYGKLDWSALRLVFQEFEGTWYLTGIVHDEWTI